MIPPYSEEATYYLNRDPPSPSGLSAVPESGRMKSQGGKLRSTMEVSVSTLSSLQPQTKTLETGWAVRQHPHIRRRVLAASGLRLGVWKPCSVSSLKPSQMPFASPAPQHLTSWQPQHLPHVGTLPKACSWLTVQTVSTLCRSLVLSDRVGFRCSVGLVQLLTPGRHF